MSKVLKRSRIANNFLILKAVIAISDDLSLYDHSFIAHRQYVVKRLFSVSNEQDDQFPIVSHLADLF